MAFVFRAVVLSVIFAGVIFTMYKLNTEGINKSLFHLEPSGVGAFLTQDVQGFEWRSPGKISALEKNPAGQWIPLDREKKLEEILSQLSSLQYGPLEQKGAMSPQVFLRLKIAENLWAGQWDGLTFLWTEGPLKGQGAVLSEPLSRSFFRGRYLFESDPQIHLCHNRVKSIRITLKSKEYRIEQNKRGWDLISKEKQKPMDPIFIEKWLIKACSIKAVSTIDPSFAPSVAPAVDRITWNYIDGSSFDFFNLEKDLVMQNDRALILLGYQAVFNELKAEIEKTQP